MAAAQVYGGFNFISRDSLKDNFVDRINIWDFYNDSSTIYMNSVKGKRMIAHAMSKQLNGTYFDWLPLELVEIIFEFERHIEITMDRQFYIRYFSDDDSLILTGRHLRPNHAQRQQIQVTGEVTGLDIIETPLGNVFGRRIRKNNTGALVTRDFQRMISSFDKNKAVGISNLLKLITKYMMWIVNHSYLCEWNAFMRVIYRKQSEFEERLALYEVSEMWDEMPKEMDTPEKRAPVWENLLKIKYFLEQYVPFKLLSQSDAFHYVVNNNLPPQDHVNTTLFEIYMMTGVHPNSIDLNKAREFEIELYAPKYYKETYSNYTKMRSGRRLIPEGEKPEFYWCAGKYIQRFL